MKVRVLQQFLQSLIPPLSAGQAQPEIVGDLETISENLSGFSDKPIRELADFLTRAQEYEQQGNWPESSPPIVGGVVDQPSPKQMAQRLTAFLQREVHSTGPASIAVFDEMERLKKAMKAPELRQMAEACGVTGKVTTAARAIEASFEHLTGRKLADVLLETYEQLLLTSRGNPTQLEEALEKLNSLGTPQLKKLAKKLGVSTTIQSKPKGIEAIREHLTRPTPTESDEPTVVEEQGSPSISEEKLSRIVATLHALREKAEPEDAPEDEINEELASLESEMNREEAIATAKAFGVPWSTHSRPDALQRIRERVFEAKISREKVEY